MSLVSNPKEKHFYGRRKGKPLRELQHDLYEQGRADIFLSKDSCLKEVFNPPHQEYILEIGFGGGEHLAAQAAAQPNIGFIGIEPFLNGQVSLLGLIKAQGLQNIRIVPFEVQEFWATPSICHPARSEAEMRDPVLGSTQRKSEIPDQVRDDNKVMVPDGFFSKIHILFPDPWPKRPHHKRRLISANNLPHIARMLKTGGELILATDHLAYRHVMDKVMNAAKGFQLVKQQEWHSPETRPLDWNPTRYETKALNDGVICTRKFYLKK